VTPRLLHRAVGSLLATLFLAGPASAASRMTDVEVDLKEQVVSVHVKISGTPRYHVLSLEGPPRVVIDIQETSFAWRSARGGAYPPPIREIRGSQWKPGVSRVVLELTHRAEYRVEERSDGLVVLLEAETGGESGAARPIAEPAPTAPGGVTSPPADTPSAASPGAEGGGDSRIVQSTTESATAVPGDGIPPSAAARGAAPPVPKPGPGSSNVWTFKGRLEIGSRHFLYERGRGLVDDNGLLEAELDVTYDLNEFMRFRLRPRLLIDPVESSRNRYEPLDAYGEFRTSQWALLAGQLLESWAIVDTFNPADVLNRRDFGRDVYDPHKLGEVMVRFRYFFPEAGALQQPTLSLYLLPLHRETPLPSNRDRFRLDATGDNVGDLTNRVINPSFDTAYAARLSATIGSADVFLFYFGGPTRLPALDVSPLGAITPVYYRVNMGGAGVQWALDKWLFKLETAYTSTRDPQVPSRFKGDVPDSYFQYVIGLDRTFTDLFGKTELTLTLEYAGEDNPGTTTLSGLRPYKSDVFFGIRWALNDRRRTELVASVAADVLVNEQLYLFELKTTLYRDLKLVLGGQFIHRAPGGRPDRFTTFNLFPNNSNIRVSLRYEF
jgi:hypothetical protein